MMITGFTLLSGLVASTLLVREGIPEISVDTVLVEMRYLGADPYEVEEGISRKVEEAIDGLEGIKRYTTVSIQNASRTVIEIVEGYPMDKALDEIRNAVDSIPNFPPDAERPVISEIKIRRETILVALWGDITERSGKELAERIKDELQALPEISQVSVSGVRDYEISIELSEEKLRQFGLSFQQVADAVRRSSVNLSGGTLRTKGEEIDIKAVGRKYTGGEFATLVVLAKPTGEIVTLDQIATIRDAFTEDDVLTRFNGQPAVTIGVFKTEDEDAIKVAKATKRYVEERAKTLPQGIHLTAWSDASEDVQARLNLLFKNGTQGFILVVLVLLLFLDVRLSLWVSMGIPASLAGALVVLYFVGGSLNVMSLLGIILVMGIIVDDAIVVGESIYHRRSNGELGVAAATHGAMEVAIPVLAAVTTTIVAFVPLFFIPSVVGKFVALVPVVVIAALSVSMIESITCLPAHLSHLPDPNKRPDYPNWLQGDKGLTSYLRPYYFPVLFIFRFLFAVRQAVTAGLMWFIANVYKPFLYRTLQYRYLALACAFGFFLFTMIGMFGSGAVKFVLFPEGDVPYLQASVEFPQGTPIQVTKAAIARTEQALRDVEAEIEAEGNEPIVKHLYSQIGLGGDIFEQRDAGSHVGVVRVEITRSEFRSVGAQEIISRWQAKTGSISGAVTQTFGTLEQGPPGAPIQVWLKGDNTEEMVAAAEEIKAKLRTYGGLYQIEDDYREGNRELQLELKPEARGLGLTQDDLASQVYAGFYGSEAIRVQRGRDEVRVKVRYARSERDTLADLQQVRIRTPQGNEVPFYSVANVKFGRTVASISRVDGRRTIQVGADLDQGVANAEEVLGDMRANFFPAFQERHPDVAWSFEGAKQQSNDAFKAVLIGFPIAMLGIFVIIAATFRSYIQPVVVMTSIPFGMTGAIYGHFFMGLPLMMFSVFGMVALAGVVVNDAIVLIEAYNTRMGQGMKLYDALCEAGGRRFRAIILTTLSTVGGMGPLIFEKNFAAIMLIPMALSVASGLLMATVSTLVIVPCLLASLNDIRCLAYRLLKGEWPAREDVEPGRNRAVDRYEEDLRKAAAAEPALVK